MHAAAAAHLSVRPCTQRSLVTLQQLLSADFRRIELLAQEDSSALVATLWEGM